MYLELHTSSAFSFLDGSSLPSTLIERAAELGYPAIALLDRDGMYGAPQFYRAAKAAGIKAIVGAELTVGHRPQAQGPSETSDAVVRSSSKVRSSKFEVHRGFFPSSFLLPRATAISAASSRARS